MMMVSLVLITFWGISAPANSDSYLVDMHDTTRVLNLIWDADEALYDGDDAEALQDITYAKTLSDSMAYAYGSYESRMVEGGILEYQGNYREALSVFNDARILAEKAENKLQEANALYNIGNMHDFLGYYPMALRTLQEANAIFKNLDDSLGLAMTYNNIANVHSLSGNSVDSYPNYRKSLNIYRDMNDSLGIAMAYGNLGNELFNYPDSLTAAAAYFEKALSIQKSIGDDTGLIYTYGSLASIELDKDNLELAGEYYQKSLDLAESIGSDYEKATTFREIGNYYILRGQRKKARSYIEQALNIAHESELKEVLYSGYYTLFQLDSLDGNYVEAIANYQNYIAFWDSVRSEESARQTVRAELEFEFEKERALAEAELKRQNLQRNISIGGFLVTIVFAGIFLFQRNRISKEKDRSEELLLNILPYETAQELKQQGYSEAKPIDHVTVLFTDFKGFTKLSEELSPQELVEAIHECFSAFDRIMQRHSVEKIKTIGDAYMAAGGLPTPNKTNAVDVVRAALEIQTYMKNQAEQRKADGKPAFEIRIGVHSGPVVAGIVGIRKFQYDIWGDTVNTASRMESSGEVGRVNVSETTFEAIQHEFTCHYRGKIEAKGKGKISMYFVDQPPEKLINK